MFSAVVLAVAMSVPGQCAGGRCVVPAVLAPHVVVQRHVTQEVLSRREYVNITYPSGRIYRFRVFHRPRVLIR